MKRFILLILGLSLSYAPFGFAAPAAPVSQPAPVAPSQAQIQQPAQPVDKGKASYSIGVDLGENFKAEGIEVNPDMLVKGLKDSLSGGKLMLTKPEMEATLTAFQKQLTAKTTSYR